MSDHSRVRFANELRDDYDASSHGDTPRHQQRDSQYPEARGRPPLRQARSSVRFMPGPTVASPKISSPVIRDPTPYHPHQEFNDSDDEDQHQHHEDSYPSVVPNLVPSATSLPALGDPPHWRRDRRSPDDYDGKGPADPTSDSFDQHQRDQLPQRYRMGRQNSEDTIYDQNAASTEKRDKDSLQEPSVPPLAYVRRGDETVRSAAPLRPALKQSSSDLENGGVPARRGIFANLMSLYGVSRRKADFDDLTLSRATTVEAAAASGTRPLRRRLESTMSEMGNMDPKPLDPDHPKVTGVKKNTKGRHTGDKLHRSSSRITGHIASMKQRQIFILRLAKALMTFGAPSHRIESQLDATATVLEVDAQFIHLPSVIITSFGDPETQTSDTHFVRASGRLALGKLHNVHQVYRQVVHDEIGAEEGTVTLMKLMKEGPLYGLKTRCVIAFACCALICPLAFGGSFLDMWVAGAGGAVLCFLQLHAANKSAMYANVFEISVAILISFISRALSTIPGQLFCYEAISSSGVVLILPGYLILCSALELASKNIVNGSVRMIYAIIYSLFLGFGLTIGSDLYLIVDSNARQTRLALATQNISMVSIHGTFTSDNSTVVPDFSGSFTFLNGTKIDADTTLGCYRDPSWPWYQQNFPIWTYFLLVPTFSLFSSSWNLQPLKSKQLLAMIFISCAAFAANQGANYYIVDRSDVVSAIGAFVIGILGNAYSRIFRGTAFQAMVIGVLFLVPSGIAAAGGLSENYHGQDGDQYTTGLAIGLRMVQVAIGITVGLFGSGLIVYSFGSRKQAALFAF